MNARTIALLATTVTVLAIPATAAADYGHVVVPGETLSSIAATDGLSVSAVAAANGLSPDAQVQIGEIIEIPPQTSYTQASTAAASYDSASSAGQTDTSTTEAATSAVGGGSYVVQPGDTLSAIAARAETTVDQLAAMNGLDPTGYLLAGSVLSLPAPGSTEATTSEATTGTTDDVADSTSPGSSSTDTSGASGPYPTDESVSGSEIADIAAQNGVSAPLAQAIGWQESGWNNDEVSDTGAVGVMQIEPSTWTWIQQHLSGGSLESGSAFDNVQGGVLLLRDLVGLTGSDSMAAAGYYQGLQSIAQNGIYPSTQQYVNDVMSLDQRFGG
jgi:N-acetylmuramoyl-L-alanine amidase